MENVNEVPERDDLVEVAHNAGKQIRNFVSSRGDEASDMVKDTVQMIRDKPIQSSLIALAAGFVLASLLRK